MSKYRPNRQERQDEAARGAKKKKLFTYAVVVILLAGALLGGRYYRNHKYDSFARCLASRKAKMYGLFWCPHCADQKAMFGSAFHYIPYVECASHDAPRELLPVCKAAGVKLFPSWQFGTDPPKEGVLSLPELSEKTGCSLP